MECVKEGNRFELLIPFQVPYAVAFEALAEFQATLIDQQRIDKKRTEEAQSQAQSAPIVTEQTSA